MTNTSKKGDEGSGIGDDIGRSSSAAARLKQALPKKMAGISTNRAMLVDDCDRPACDDVASKMQQMLVAASHGSTSAAISSEKEKMMCPPNSAEIGRASWTLLHSMVRCYRHATLS